MLVKNAEKRNMIEVFSLKEIVPQDHLPRKIDAAIDFTKIYEFVEELYGKENGRPSVGAVQDRYDTAYLWHPIFAQDAGGRKLEPFAESDSMFARISAGLANYSYTYKYSGVGRGYKFKLSEADA